MRRTAPSDLLKAAIELDGRSLNRIAREAGVNVSLLSRFTAGRRGISATTLDRLAAVLDLELRPRKAA